MLCDATGVRMIRALQSTGGPLGNGSGHLSALQPWIAVKDANGTGLGSPSPDRDSGLVQPRPKRPRTVRPATDDFLWERRYSSA